MKPTSVRIPEDLLRQAKHLAIEQETTVQQLIIDGLRLRLATKPSKGGERK